MQPTQQLLKAALRVVRLVEQTQGLGRPIETRIDIFPTAQAGVALGLLQQATAVVQRARELAAHQLVAVVEDEDQQGAEHHKGQALVSLQQILVVAVEVQAGQQAVAEKDPGRAE